MLKKTFLYASAISSFLCSTALAEPANLTVSVDGIKDGEMIPRKFAYCIADGKGKHISGPNINPAISWASAPEGTKSYAVIVVDSEVPQDFSNAGREGKVVSKDAPRRDFYHWVLFDIPASLSGIKEGQNSSKLVAAGKPVGKTDYGINARNDYSGLREKPIGGYDGPCPPWNDEKMHRYHFQVYALDVPSLGLSADSEGANVMEKIKEHTLAKAEVTGLYSLNETLLKKKK